MAAWAESSLVEARTILEPPVAEDVGKVDSPVAEDVSSEKKLSGLAVISETLGMPLSVNFRCECVPAPCVFFLSDFWELCEEEMGLTKRAYLLDLPLAVPMSLSETWRFRTLVGREDRRGLLRFSNWESLAVRVIVRVSFLLSLASCHCRLSSFTELFERNGSLWIEYRSD